MRFNPLERWYRQVISRQRKSAKRLRRATLGQQLERLEDRALLSAITPAEMRQAYGIDQVKFGAAGIPGNGAGQTIGIIEIGTDASLVSDLQYFDQQLFGAGATGAVARHLRQLCWPSVRIDEALVRHDSGPEFSPVGGNGQTGSGGRARRRMGACHRTDGQHRGGADRQQSVGRRVRRFSNAARRLHRGEQLLSLSQSESGELLAAERGLRRDHGRHGHVDQFAAGGLHAQQFPSILARHYCRGWHDADPQRGWLVWFRNRLGLRRTGPIPHGRSGVYRARILERRLGRL